MDGCCLNVMINACSEKVIPIRASKFFNFIIVIDKKVSVKKFNSDLLIILINFVLNSLDHVGL